MHSDLKCLEKASFGRGNDRRDQVEADTSWENVGNQMEALVVQVEDKFIIGHWQGLV